MTTPLTKKVKDLTVVTNLQTGDKLVGERVDGTTVLIPYTAPAGAADGDKGDITVSAGGTIWKIDTPASATVAADDKVLIKDTSSSDDIKYVTAQAIADLSSGGVSSVNSKTGIVVINPDDLVDTTTTHKFVTAANITTLGNTSGTNTGDQTNILGNAATVTTNANLTGPVTSTGNATAIAAGAISNTMLANGAVANLSGTNTGDQTVTLTSDVTGSGTGSFATTIAAGAVTLDKQANMATASLVYRKTAGSGAPEINTLTTLKTDLGLTGTNSGDQTNISGNAATVTTNANLTGPVTSAGNATSITDKAVTLAKMADIATSSLIYRKTAGTGAPESNTLATVKTDLGLTGTNSGDQTNISGNAATVTTNANLTGPVTSTGNATSITDKAVTLAKMNDIATSSLIYRKTVGTGVPEINTLATVKTDLGLTGTNSGDQTVTLTGNVTGSGTGSFAATIANSAVTLAKQADMATASVVSRKTAGTGAPEINTVATLKTDLGLTGTNSGDQTSIVGITGTKAQFDTAVTDGNIVYTDSLGTNVATFLATPSSANLAAALTDETGTGAAVFATSPNITTPNIVGTSTNNNAAAGSVGEEIDLLVTSASAISLTTAIVVNIGSVSLNVGDWDVTGQVAFTIGSTTSITDLRGGFNATSATFPSAVSNTYGCMINTYAATVPGTSTQVFPISRGRISLAATTTIYLVSRATFTLSTISTYGSLNCRRVR